MPILSGFFKTLAGHILLTVGQGHNLSMGKTLDADAIDWVQVCSEAVRANKMK